MKLTLSCVSFLNALPYVEGLKALQGAEQPRVLLDPPYRCAERLRAGEVDAALIPSIELAVMPGIRPAGGLGIASRREVRSVVLLTRRPPAELRSVAVDSNSRTSVALLRILLARQHGCRPVFDALPPDPVAMLREHDAALLIGDAALGAPRRELEVVDLASAWHRMTGLPFVFALWAARDEERALRAGALLRRCLSLGMERLEGGALAGHAASAGMDPERLRLYLMESIHYRLGEKETASLRLYFRLCREEGVLEGAVPA